jgi:hypothetical protein
LGENILVKSPYYEKGKKGKKREYPFFSPTTQPHPRNKSLSSSLKLNIFKNPLRMKIFNYLNPYALITQLFEKT